MLVVALWENSLSFMIESFENTFNMYIQVTPCIHACIWGVKIDSVATQCYQFSSHFLVW